MSVFVDRLRPTPKSRAWPYEQGCHMLADSVEELQSFARSIGLLASWYQPKSFPHYDLTPSRRKRALRAGAIAIDRNQVVALIRKHRARKVAAP